MSKYFLAALLGFLVATVAHAREPIRIDASSNEAAEASWLRMVESARGAKKQRLPEAMLKIDLAGVLSVYEVIDDPELKSLGIARIKDQVAGMTAEEIIALGERVGTVKIQKPRP